MNIDWIRKYCLSLPAVTEDIKWDNDLVFSVGGKMFCMLALDPPFKCSFKIKDEEFEEWCYRDGFARAPYMARAKWVLLTDPSKLLQKDWEKCLKQSYDLVKMKLTRKLREQLGIQ